MKVSCPICGSEAHFFARVEDRMFSLVTEHFSIYDCNLCKSLFIFPLPSMKQLIKHYEDIGSSYYSFKISKGEKIGIIERIWKEIAHSNAIPRTNSIEGLKGERLLDVGAGVGEFLIKARPFFKEVYGVDVSSYTVRVCRERGLKVYKGSYEQVEFPKDFLM